ncbi:MAG TPA: YdcF family protein, partial [Firmicutes bacterium]|nr:YdcF family protein [Bacillota bacterium]
IHLIKAIYSFFIPPGILVLLLAGLAFGTRRRSKKTATLLAIITIILYIASTNYFGAFFIRSLEDRYSIPTKVDPDVIIVLGGGATSDTPDLSGLGGLSGSAANRLLTAVRLYNIHKVPIIFSGGQVFRDAANE